MPIERSTACILAVQERIEENPGSFSDSELDGIVIIKADSEIVLHVDTVNDDNRAEVMTKANKLFTDPKIETLIVKANQDNTLLESILSGQAIKRLIPRNLPSGKDSQYSIKSKNDQEVKPIKIELLNSTFKITTNQLNVDDISLDAMMQYYGIESEKSKSLLDEAYDILAVWEAMQPFYFFPLQEKEKQPSVKDSAVKKLMERRTQLLAQRKKIDMELKEIDQKMKGGSL
ncbi:hypothetical protein SAMN02910447_03138 [Ruminococcus sp. YE71]|uniref:hypothetical protein n=1 Tax=unclassified Ruminococcus TaxID=2608920 RepID=UPI0008886BB6|nr:MULTISPECIES: hypothetical protein [unclassified Ruminococcus]SDA30042.1 hypothetical protein SAMN02910446_03209 [Ruminococcus sp. YE78]SFW49111.1 hypothetical protein SAMN02910447_03138 [Ruminococcus sp. YE71]